jgi:hypothetical protein
MSLSTKSFIGGARLGRFNATVPFARLVVSSGKAQLRCFKTYELTPSDTMCEQYGSIPLFSWGVRFHHIRAEFPDPFIFWCFGRKRVLETLRKAGFEIR